MTMADNRLIFESGRQLELLNSEQLSYGRALTTKQTTRYDGSKRPQDTSYRGRAQAKTATIDARIMPYDGKSIPEYIARCEDAVGERVRLIYNGKDRGEYIVVGVQFVPEIDATCGIFACAISFNLTEGTIRYKERIKDVVV